LTSPLVVESFPLSPSTEDPKIVELDFPPLPKRKPLRPIPVTASICLDFASPHALTGLPSRPALILAPASTWSREVSMAMWEQARARADETGSMVLFCDGGSENSVSGIAGHGMREVTQVGPGSWTKNVAVDWPFDERRTMYAAAGDWTMAAIVWATLGVGWITEIAVGKAAARLIRGETLRGLVIGAINRVRGLAGRQRRDEEQPLLQ
jgi:hypothetical protein